MLSMKRHFCCLTIVVPFLAVASQAEVSCDDDEKLIDCWRGARAVKKSGADNVKRMMDEPTGSDTQSANLASNTKNFLPFLAMTGLLGDATEGQSEGTLAFDLNFLIPGTGLGKNAQLQAIVNTEAKLSEALKTDLEMKLPEESQEDSLKKLSAGIGDLGEYSIAFTYNLNGRNGGRNFETYSRRFEALADEARKEVKAPDTDDVIDQLGEALEDANLTVAGGDPLQLTIKEIEDQAGADKAQRIKKAFETWIEAEGAGVVAAEKSIKDNYLHRFGGLIDNQPQFHFSARKTFREDLVGGDEEALKLTYEWGQTNFKNAMSDSCHEDLDKVLSAVNTADQVSCLTEYKNYVASNKDSIAKGTRLSISAEYVDISEKVIDFSMTPLGDAGLEAFTLPGAEKLIISAGYSRDFRGEGGVATRLDLVGKYENVSNDPMRQDRGVITLTVTRKVGTMTIPFGIVYANHSEFLGDVDEQLSTHIGLKFNLSSLTGLIGNL